MSPLTRTLLALACAALFRAASAARLQARTASANKLTHCFSKQIAIGNPRPDPEVEILPKFKITGHKTTSITIENICQDLPEIGREFKLVAENITICTENLYDLDIITPKNNALSPVEVDCTLSIFRELKIPCYFNDVPMEVSVTEFCNEDWWPPGGQIYKSTDKH